MMLFLRSLVANLYFYPAMALGFVVSLPVGVFSRPAMVAMWDKFLHPVIWSGMLKLCGITIEVRGKEYITPGVIFASKHESAFETYAYTDIIPHSVFVLKKELTYIPLFGWGQALYGMIPVDRGAGARAMKGMLAEAKKRVAAGRSIIIFPEGTRSKGDEMHAFKMGSLQPAYMGKAAIVPVTLKHCYALDEKKSHIRSISVIYGKPIPYEEYGKIKQEELLTRLHDEIQRNVYAR